MLIITSTRILVGCSQRFLIISTALKVNSVALVKKKYASYTQGTLQVQSIQKKKKKDHIFSDF